ncbi:hypothetical protein G0U57_005556, partial [Chelydra serpentina]
QQEAAIWWVPLAFYGVVVLSKDPAGLYGKGLMELSRDVMQENYQNLVLLGDHSGEEEIPQQEDSASMELQRVFSVRSGGDLSQGPDLGKA